MSDESGKDWLGLGTKLTKKFDGNLDGDVVDDVELLLEFVQQTGGINKNATRGALIESILDVWFRRHNPDFPVASESKRTRFDLRLEYWEQIEGQVKEKHVRDGEEKATMVDLLHEAVRYYMSRSSDLRDAALAWREAEEKARAEEAAAKEDPAAPKAPASKPDVNIKARIEEERAKARKVAVKESAIASDEAVEGEV